MMGLDHRQLTFLHNGRAERPTVLAGEVVKAVFCVGFDMKRLCLDTSGMRVAPAFAADDPKAEKEILAIMDAYKDAMIHNDAAVLRETACATT